MSGDERKILVVGPHGDVGLLLAALHHQTDNRMHCVSVNELTDNPTTKAFEIRCPPQVDIPTFYLEPKHNQRRHKQKGRNRRKW